MTWIHKVGRLGPAAAGLGALILLVMLPATVVAAGHSHRPASTAAADETVAQATTPTAACTAAKQALTNANTNDKKTEDVSEKKNSTQTGAANLDPSEDKTEDAALKVLKTKAHTACTPPACLTAEQKLKDAQTKDATEGKNEKTTSTENSTSDQSEDKTEAGNLKTLKDAKRAACTSSGK
jgi:hypothetical protein